MSVEERVEEWLRKMGYDGEVPSSLSKICNPSTAFIWEQVITNLKPRQEVDIIKKTIIVNRLSQKPLEQQDQFSFPIKEIQVYMEKQRLEKHIKNLETTIEEKTQTVDALLRKNKITYMKIENIKAKIKAHQEKEFLLRKKATMIEKDNEHAQDVLSMARNLTPVEMEASTSPDEITKTLQQCAEKLQKLCDGVSMPQPSKTRSALTPVMKTVKKPLSSNCGTFSRFLSESTVLSDIAPSTCKKINYKNKENFNFTQHSTAISRCLKFSDSGDEKNIDDDKTEKNPKRESLGLLSADCLDTSDDLDKFLLGSGNESGLQPLTDSQLEPSSKKPDHELLEKLRSEKNVTRLLRDLLHKNNRCLIMTQCGNIYEQLLKELRTSIMSCDKLVGSYTSKRTISKSDLSELYFIHVKTELEKEKCRIQLKQLQEAVKRKKEEILVSNRTRDSDEIKTILELQIEDAYLKGANNFLRKQVDSAKQHDSDTDIEVISLKIKQAQEDIVARGSDIQNLVSIIYKIFQDIQNNQNETSLCVKKLSPFIHDFTWANKMTQCSMSREIELFKDIPVEFNRKFNTSELQLYHRNISDTTIPSYVEFDSETLDMVARLIDTPYSPAESVIIDALKMKVLSKKLSLLKSPSESLNVEYQKSSLEELRKREDYVEPLMDELNSIINSDGVKEVLSAPNSMKEIAELWLEMPCRNFISEKRQVDGHGYKHYERILEELKNN